MEGYLLGLGVVLDNPSFYDHTALQPIILHHQHLFFLGKFTYKELQQILYVFRKIKMTIEYLRQEKQWK